MAVAIVNKVLDALGLASDNGEENENEEVLDVEE